MPDGPMVDAEMLAVHVLGKTGEDVSPSTLRSWVRRGHIRRHRGGLFSLAEVNDWLARRKGNKIRRQSQATGEADSGRGT